jgi:hypothetical protein
MNEQINILEKKAKDILARCESWKKCQDGSYEMALSNSGYYDIIEQVQSLKQVSIK